MKSVKWLIVAACLVLGGCGAVTTGAGLELGKITAGTAIDIVQSKRRPIESIRQSCAQALINIANTATDEFWQLSVERTTERCLEIIKVHKRWAGPSFLEKVFRDDDEEDNP